MTKPALYSVPKTRGIVPPVTKTAVPVYEGLEQFIAEQAAHFGFTGQNVSALHEAIRTNPVLGAMDAHSLKTSVLNAFNDVNQLNTLSGAVELPTRKKVALEHVLKAAQVVEDRQKPVAPRPEMIKMLQARVETARAPASQPHRSFSAAISNEQKVNAGIWLAAAALSALGAYHSGKQVKVMDKDGESHIQWSQTGVSLIQAALTCGCVYMGMQALGRGGR